MSEVRSGLDALNELNRQDESSGGSNVEFSPFRVGTTYTVKIINRGDLIRFFSYGIFGVTNSFVAKNPSTKSQKGWPQENLTPWDKAFYYHQNRSEEFQDAESKEAYKYKPKERYGFVFFDLDQGKEIIIDVSKKQAGTLDGVIKKMADKDKLGKTAFEVSKAEGGAVSITPVLDMEDDLTDKQKENFDKAPEEIDLTKYHGINYEADEKEMLASLTQAGFDISLIDEDGAELEDVDVTDDDLPF